MYDFTYHRPGSIDDAVSLRKTNDDGAYLAGGMTLLSTLKLRLAQHSDLIDLQGLGLDGISVSKSAITIKAGTTHAAVAASKDIQKACPALSELAGKIGDPHVRHRGTIGGSVANNDPAADYPAAVLGLNATVKTNAREIAADDFFVSLFETALEEGELITEISFPVPKRAGYAKFPNPASRYALVGVMVAETGDGVRAAVTGAGDCVFRAGDIEAALSKKFAPDALGAIEIAADTLNGDLHGSAEYRAHLVGVMARRAVAAALG